MVAQNKIKEILSTVTDPEVPVLNILDLGIVREINVDEKEVEVVITPTYSGCPAMDFISVNIKSALQEQGYEKVKVKLVLSPAWTTDWMSESAHEKLRAYGIAPPQKGTIDKSEFFSEFKQIECPLCKSMDTKMISQFGSTACKALFQCDDCLEPFDYFKCLK